MFQHGAQYGPERDRWSIEVSAPPASEPVTTAEAKAHARIDHSDDDAYIDSLIEAARSLVEARTGRSLITQTLILRLDGFPRNIGYDFRRVTHDIVLPRPPVQSVSSVVYIDTDGTSVTLDPSKYDVDTKGHMPRIVPAYGEVWPITRPATPNAVTITYDAGWTQASLVPAPLRHAIKLLVSHWYENREHVVVGTTAGKIPDTVDSLINPYRVRF